MIYRFYATKDNWITNKVIISDVTARASGSNEGANPVLNLFKTTGSFPNSYSELARILVQFNATALSGLVFNSLIIPSSSVTYTMKMFDYRLSDTLPTSYDVYVYPLSSSWDEGTGIDSINFRDLGYSNWLSASSTATWQATGSDYISGSMSASQHFDKGFEDLEVDVTPIVNAWLSGNLSNNGVVIKMGNTEENNQTDYYRKAFYGRETQTVDKIPYLEARWDDSLRDNRANFAYNVSSSLFLYNVIRGLPTTPQQPVYMRIQDHVVGVSASYSATFTASLVDTGILTTSLYISNTASFSASWVDIWYSGSVVYLSSTFQPLSLTSSDSAIYPEYVAAPQMKRVYGQTEVAHIKVNVRQSNYQNHVNIPTGSLNTNREYIDNMYWQVINNESGEIVVPFATGSVQYTRLGYNKDGNYFNLFMSSFLPGFVYRLQFMILTNKFEKFIIDDNFLFKVI